MDRRTLIIGGLVLLVVATGAWGFQQHRQAERLEGTLSESRAGAETLADGLLLLAGENASSADAADILSSKATQDAQTSVHVSRVTVPVVAYDAPRDTGRLLNLSVVLGPGDGIYVDIGDAQVGERFQSAVRSAAARSQRLGGDSGLQRGVLVRLNTPQNWDSVGGDSIDASLVAAMVAARSQYTYNDGVVISAAVGNAGQLQSVGAVREKAEAAREAGKDMLVVPRGQYVSVSGIEVVTANTIEDALQYSLTE